LIDGFSLAKKNHPFLDTLNPSRLMMASELESPFTNQYIMNVSNRF
jgi:hypothetical protein